MTMRRFWFAACDAITRMGPYATELNAYRALRLAPREATTRIVAADFRAPDLGLRLSTTAEVKDGQLAPGARVWAEERQ